MGNGRLTIRDLDVKDVEPVLRILEVLNLSRWSRADIEDELEATGSVMLAAVLDDELVGFIIGRSVPGTEDGKFDAEIYNLGVIPNYHRNGIGGSLLRGFLTRLKDRETVNIWLEVRAGNLSAVEFYKRNGFVEIVTRKGFYANPVEDAIIMCLTF